MVGRAVARPHLQRTAREERTSGRRTGLAECPIVTLPDEVANGIGSNEERTYHVEGQVASTLDERGPSPLDLDVDVRLDEAKKTVTRVGWTLHAHAGEKFSFEFRFSRAVASEPLPIRIQGPIADCAATTKLSPEKGGTWTAPAEGDYFVTGAPPMSRYDGVTKTRAGIFAVHWMLSPRRLDDAGVPLPHHFAHTWTWGRKEHGDPWISHVADAVLRDLDHDGDLDILAHVKAGTTYAPSQGLYRIDQEAGGTWTSRPIVSTAFEGPPGPMLVADFDGDGLDDAFATTSKHLRELYVGQPDGSYVNHSWPVDKKHLFTNDVGATDADGDGDLDVVTFSVGHGGSSRIHWLRLLTNDGTGKFTEGAPSKHVLPPVKGSYVERYGMHDVDADGKPEAIIEELGPTDRIMAYALPDFVEVPVDPSLLDTLDIDRQFERRVDVEGDGRLDVLSVRGVDWTRLAVGVEFGLEDGSRTLPWFTYPEGGHTSNSGMLDVGDVDGDGCLDALVAANQLFLVQGRNCVPPPVPTPGSCAAVCGGTAPDGACWCDASCLEFGDCCANKLSACP